MITIALVEDHTLLRNTLAAHINTLDGYTVVLEARNGKHFTEQLNPANLPRMVLLDILMPEMDGFDTAVWVSTHYPQVQIIALSMLTDESAIIRMLRSGAKGYIVKDAEINELKKAMDAVVQKGMYINQLLYNHILPTIHDTPMGATPDQLKLSALSAREKEFLKWLCTDKAYKEIAVAMFVSPRTVDGYRDSLLEKLNVPSRIGLVIFAIRNHIVEI